MERIRFHCPEISALRAGAGVQEKPGDYVVPQQGAQTERLLPKLTHMDFVNLILTIF